MTANKPNQDRMEQTRSRNHSSCVVCGRAGGLELGFSSHADGSVEALFHCRDSLQGYQGLLHGGVISALLDGAMTNCLFAHGIVAVTAELIVRFRHPVAIDGNVVVIGRITRSSPPLHLLEAEVRQDGIVMALAKSKFMETAK